MAFIGDLHAAQGHGEVIGGGIETSGTVAFSLRRLESPTDTPWFLSREHLAAIAIHSDLRAALQNAFAALVARITFMSALNPHDVLAVVSQIVTFELGNVSAASAVVAARVPRTLFAIAPFADPDPRP